MARVAVLIDRSPACPEWKGAVAWRVINALAESQHDVQVFTTESLDEIGETHARVGVARPAPSFALTTLPRWTRALLGHQPDVIHTFAPRKARTPETLTCWPYFDALKTVLPRAGRVATLFEAADLATPARRWLLGHGTWATFDPGVVLESGFAGEVDVLGLGDLIPSNAESAVDGTESEYLAPAPVGEWPDVESGVAGLGAFLREDPTRIVRVVGGWGDLDLRARRRTWDSLAELGARVHLSPPLGLAEFARDAGASRGLWRATLKPGSWRARVGALVAGETAGGDDVVNRLSRIYSAPGRW